MKTLIRTISALLEQGEPLALATVVGNLGSTPRSSGAKLALTRDGRLLGTVGGGIVEAKAMEMAAKLLDGEPGAAELLEMDLTSDLAAGTDMICGGRMTLLLERLDSPESGDESGGQAWMDLDKAMRQGQTCVLLTRFSQGPGMRAVGHELLRGEDARNHPAVRKGGAGLEQTDGDIVLAEPFVPPAPVLFYGAGHVSRATAHLAAFAGFRVVVLDDRADFANAERFPDADSIVVLPDFENVLDHAQVDETAFVVILTRGHAHDKTVLAQALRTPARYVGMIGSKTKRDAIYEALRGEGFTEEDIARCYSPIGLEIGAQTPEEIALSIVSELVAVRAAAREGKGA